MFSAVYSSLSSSMPYPSATRSLNFCSNLSEMYFRKISPRTTCLYSEASILPLNRSAAFQICFSNPTSAELTLAIMIFDEFFYLLSYWRYTPIAHKFSQIKDTYTIMHQIMSLFCQQTVTNRIRLAKSFGRKQVTI